MLEQPPAKYEPPTKEQFRSLIAYLQEVDEGEPLHKMHNGRSIPYTRENEHGVDVRDYAYTCSCGKQRLVKIEYGTERSKTGTYVVCVECDAVHLQPRFSEAREP